MMDNALLFGLDDETNRRVRYLGGGAKATMSLG